MDARPTPSSRTRPPSLAWWTLLIVTLAVIVLWPPDQGRSLAVKTINWGVDPLHQLPVLPPQLGYGMGDDPQVVEARDAEVRRYDIAYAEGGLMRQRLLLKVARDPFNPQTERQLLLVFGAIAWFAVWRLGGLR